MSERGEGTKTTVFGCEVGRWEKRGYVSAPFFLAALAGLASGSLGLAVAAFLGAEGLTVIFVRSIKPVKDSTAPPELTNKNAGDD